MPTADWWRRRSRRRTGRVRSNWRPSRTCGAVPTGSWKGFVVCGVDNQWHWATAANIEGGDSVVVTCAEVPAAGVGALRVGEQSAVQPGQRRGAAGRAVPHRRPAADHGKGTVLTNPSSVTAHGKVDVEYKETPTAISRSLERVATHHWSEWVGGLKSAGWTTVVITNRLWNIQGDCENSSSRGARLRTSAGAEPPHSPVS